MLIRILVCVSLVKATVGFSFNAIWSQKKSVPCGRHTPSFNFDFGSIHVEFLLLLSW